MLPFNALKWNTQAQAAFTLAETAIIVLIVGILGAISAPSFLTALNTRRVNQALENLETALKLTQQEAVRQSRDCNLNIPTGNDPTITGTTGTYNCLRLGSQTLTGINIRSSATSSPLIITFDLKGRPNGATVSTEQVVVLSPASGGGASRCLVVAPGIGMSRIGTYNGTDTIASNCITPQQ
jgi:type II secretory pathway pseudopilin PulG